LEKRKDQRASTLKKKKKKGMKGAVGPLTLRGEKFASRVCVRKKESPFRQKGRAAMRAISVWVPKSRIPL